MNHIFAYFFLIFNFQIDYFLKYKNYKWQKSKINITVSLFILKKMIKYCLYSSFIQCRVILFDDLDNQDIQQTPQIKVQLGFLAKISHFSAFRKVCEKKTR